MRWWFRRGSRYDLAVSMVGPKLGDRLLQIGCGDGGLLAALAARVGLTGQATGVDQRPESAARARQAAVKAGVLVDVQVAPATMLPLDDESFDIVVLRDLLPSLRPDERVGCVREVYRVLRPGGRCVAIEAAVRGGIGAVFSQPASDPIYRAAGGALAALKADGFYAARILGEREGLQFVEAVRPRTAA